MSAVATTKELTIIETIKSRRTDFEALLKANGVNIDRFQNNALMAISNNADIASGNVTTKSVFNVCSRAAQDGVMLDGKEAAIVIGSRKIDDKWVKEAQYRLMVGGIIKQIHRSPSIKRIIAQVVYEQDDISINLSPDADTNPVSHKIVFDVDRGSIRGAYAYAQLTSGEYTSPEYMSVKQIELVRDKYSKKDKEGKFSAMWENSFDEACIKTVLHRAAKRLPLGEDVGGLLDDDVAIEEINVTPETPIEKVKRKKAVDVVLEAAEEPTVIEGKSSEIAPADDFEEVPI